ncbi:MAG TPA: hypothetical protein VJH97_05980 [Candidatus Nanoarchaeia archaeon]|nr:hypothetical protein [Candidatus Nanoarchaeia archaeon]
MDYIAPILVRELSKDNPGILLFHRNTDDPMVVQQESSLVRLAVENVESFYGFRLPIVAIFLQYSEDGKSRPASAGKFWYNPNLPNVSILSLDDEQKVRKHQMEEGRFPRDYRGNLISLQPRLLDRLAKYAEHRFRTTVAHEVTHLFNAQSIPYLGQHVKWFDEGLAEYVCMRYQQTDGVSSVEQLLEESWKPRAVEAFELHGFVNFATPLNLFEYQVWDDFTNHRKSTEEFERYAEIDHYDLAHLFIRFLLDVFGKQDRLHKLFNGDIELSSINDFERGFQRVFDASCMGVFSSWQDWLGVKKR